MKARLKRAFEPDGLGLGWQIALSLPQVLVFVLLLATPDSHRGRQRALEFLALVVWGITQVAVRPLVIRHRRRNGWTKVKLDDGWRWFRPGESPGEHEESANPGT